MAAAGSLTIISDDSSPAIRQETSRWGLSLVSSVSYWFEESQGLIFSAWTFLLLASTFQYFFCCSGLPKLECSLHAAFACLYLSQGNFWPSSLHAYALDLVIRAKTITSDPPCSFIDLGQSTDWDPLREFCRCSSRHQCWTASPKISRF